nr:dual specificity protein phosphatase family protein [Dactylosporangium thailandense]
MKTRAKDHGEPFADDPWNEIVGGLWMGGHHHLDAGVVVPAVVGSEFDLVVSLHERDGHGPDPGVEHRVVDVPDQPLRADQLEAVRRVAELTADAVRADRRVLVRCHRGYNRSGLVIAHALVLLGHQPDDAIDMIRRRRSTRALNNATFVDYIRTGLDVACLLTGLEPPH